MKEMGGDPNKINPLVPAELVIDHSVQVDAFGTPQAFQRNAELEFERNQERYAFLRWGQGAFHNFKVVPPDTGIVHQVNLEYLARVVFVDDGGGNLAYPDTLVGTDSHTTMINGLGVLGWGVGGIEAEAAMLGQPMSMLIPQVLGFKLTGELPRGGDRHRPRADRHRDAARARRRRQVRRVPRRRPGRPAAGRPGHDRQHVPRVRLDLRHLPDRRRDAALPGVLRPPRRADRAGRGLRQGAGALARRELRGADVLGHDRARPRRGRAEHRRPQAAAGPRLADRVARRLPDGAGRPAARRGRRRRRRGRPGQLPGLRRAGQQRQPRPRPGAPRRNRRGPGRRPPQRPRAGHARRRHRDRARPRPRRDRGHHQLHQHLQPVGDARRRDPGAQRRRRRGCRSSRG